MRDGGTGCGGFFAWVPVAVAGLAALVWMVPGAPATLEFDRAAILDGAVWRALTGQLTHWDGRHLFWNIAGAGLLAVLFRDLPTRFWNATGWTAALAVAIGLLIEPEPLARYRGLSGVLYGWWVAALLRHSAASQRLHRSVAGIITLWAFVEALAPIGAPRILDSGAAVRATAHVYGIGGAVLATCAWNVPRRSRA